MADKTLNVRVKHKYDTEANWTSKNPVLLAGELAFSNDKNGQYKIGDGKTTWKNLVYATAAYVPWTGVTGKPTSFTPSSHTHKKTDITDFPTMLPASDVSDWAKAKNKPSYTKSEVGLGNVDNTADINKSVKYATNAGTAGTCTGNAATASKASILTTPRKIDGVNFNAASDITHYGTCSTDAAIAAKVVSLSNFTLVTGSRIIVKFTVTNTATSPTLNVNSTGAKAIKYRGDAISAGYLAANRTYEFVYDGTNYILVGDLNTDTNTKVTNTLETTTKAYITGTTSATTNTGTQVFDTGVYLDTTAGKLVAKTFSGSLEGNATSATTAKSCSGNAATATKFNATHKIGNAAFDGSGDISLAQIGAAASSHSHNYAGSSSAGGAATSANKLATARKISLTGAITGSGSFDGSGDLSLATSVNHSHTVLTLTPSSRPTSLNFDLSTESFMKKLCYSIATSSTTTGKPPADAHVLTFAWDTDSGCGSQLAITHGSKTPHLYIRASATVDNKAVWNGWTTLLDSSNYTSYTVKKDGTGATGTWGISVSGNAATATKATSADSTTKLTTSRSIFGNSFNGTADVEGQALVYGSKTTSSSMYNHSGLQIRENDLVKNTQSDLAYAPSIGFHWLGVAAGTIHFHKDGIFYFKKQNGTDKATISANLSGNATTATKLSTVRTVSGGTDITMNFNYDGSANSTATLGYYNCTASNGNTNNYSYHRIAKLDTITESYTDKTTTLYITQDFNGGYFGIVRISLRTNNVTNKDVATAEVTWLARYGFDLDAVQIGLYNVAGATYADAFLKLSGTYRSTTIRAVASGARGTISRTWTLVSSNEANSTTTSDAKTSTESYASISSAATKLHNKAYSTTISGIDVGLIKTSTRLYSNVTGSSTQPVYFSNGVPVACTYTLGKSVPSDAKFTDTNTWRGIQNNLTSTSTTDSLSANQGKILKGLIDGKASSKGGQINGNVTIGSLDDTTYNLTVNGNLTTNGNLTINGSFDKDKSILLWGDVRFVDYYEQDNTIIEAYRRPVSSVATKGLRVGFLRARTYNGKKQFQVKGEWGTDDGNGNYIGKNAAWDTKTITMDGESDIRLKKDIKNSSVNALSVITNMKVREFTWKESGIHQSLGLIADEVERLDPLLAIGGGYNADGEMDIKCIDRLLLSEYAIKGIQEQQDEILDLQNENKELKEKLSEIDKLKKELDELKTLITNK